MKGYVNNCGKLNLNTGRNAHFNVLKDWKDDGSTHVVLFNRNSGARAVGGCGEYKPGELVELYAAGNHRFLCHAVVDLCVPCNAEGLRKIKEVIGANSISFGTWD